MLGFDSLRLAVSAERSEPRRNFGQRNELLGGSQNHYTASLPAEGGGIAIGYFCETAQDCFAQLARDHPARRSAGCRAAAGKCSHRIRNFVRVALPDGDLF